MAPAFGVGGFDRDVPIAIHRALAGGDDEALFGEHGSKQAFGIERGAG